MIGRIFCRILIFETEVKLVRLLVISKELIQRWASIINIQGYIWCKLLCVRAMWWLQGKKKKHMFGEEKVERTNCFRNVLKPNKNGSFSPRYKLEKWYKNLIWTMVFAGLSRGSGQCSYPRALPGLQLRGAPPHWEHHPGQSPCWR